MWRFWASLFYGLVLTAAACLAATDNPGSSGEPPGVLVPEPATWQLLLIGGGAAAGARMWSKYRRRP